MSSRTCRWGRTPWSSRRITTTATTTERRASGQPAPGARGAARGGAGRACRGHARAAAAAHPPAGLPGACPGARLPRAALLVSGTDAYRRGEYVYQDYLFDDHGADTTPGLGASANWASQPLFCPAAGDVEYPAGDRYRNNAADLAEFRVRLTRSAV